MKRYNACMRTQNVTLSLPKDLLRKAKQLAIERNTSLSGLLASTLAEIVENEDGYEKARLDYMKWLEEGHDLGTGGKRTWTRDELHERH